MTVDLIFFVLSWVSESVNFIKRICPCLINNPIFYFFFIFSHWIWANKHWFHCPSWNSDGYFGHDICSWRRPIQEETKKKEIRNCWQKTGIHWKLQYKSTFEASLHQKCTKPTKKKEIYTSVIIFNFFVCVRSFLVLTNPSFIPKVRSRLEFQVLAFKLLTLFFSNLC